MRGRIGDEKTSSQVFRLVGCSIAISGFSSCLKSSLGAKDKKIRQDKAIGDGRPRVESNSGHLRRYSCEMHQYYDVRVISRFFEVFLEEVDGPKRDLEKSIDKEVESQAG